MWVGWLYYFENDRSRSFEVLIAQAEQLSAAVMTWDQSIFRSSYTLSSFPPLSPSGTAPEFSPKKANVPNENILLRNFRLACVPQPHTLPAIQTHIRIHTQAYTSKCCRLSNDVWSIFSALLWIFGVVRVTPPPLFCPDAMYFDDFCNIQLFPKNSRLI